MPSSGLDTLWIGLPSTDVLGFAHIVPQGGTSGFHAKLFQTGGGNSEFYSVWVTGPRQSILSGLGGESGNVGEENGAVGVYGTEDSTVASNWLNFFLLRRWIFTHY